MWGLDRFSAHTTPSQSPPARNYSPAPRRSIQPSRPGLAPRSSSLSLGSANASTSSLPGTGSKTATGSGLKNQIQAPLPEEVEDPLKALERIIGSALDIVNGKSGSDVAGSKPREKPETVVEDIDFKGLSLLEYASQDSINGPTQSNGDPSPSIPHAVEEYEKERERFEDLHKSIYACDDVLSSVEKYLASFQSDLAAVSAEIESLQSRSTGLNTKLETRKEVEALLSPVVDEITMPPKIVKKIADEPVDMSWVAALEELQSRAKALDQPTKDGGAVKAKEDLKPLIQQLSDRAVVRIRDHFANQIKSLRSPNINAQIIQRQSFLPYKALYAFLAERQPKLSEDLLQAYINTMRWYYLSHFQRYHASLSKLKLYVTDRKDLVGDEPSFTRSTKASAASLGPTGFGSAAVPTHDPLNLSRRIDLLRHPSSNALPSHAAEDSTTPHHAETPFLSFNLALLDNASFEYSFLASFLPQGLAKGSNISSAFNTIFAPCLQLGRSLTKSLTGDSFDALGILLLVRLTQHFAFVIQRRKVPALESYINGTNMELWPRFQTVMDAHCESIRRAATAAPSRGGASSSALASLTGGGSGSGSGTANGAGSAQSTAPHPLTQRFAALTHSILLLSSPAIEQSVEYTGPRTPATPHPSTPTLSPIVSRVDMRRPSSSHEAPVLQRPPITTLSAPTAEPVSPALLRLRTEYFAFLDKAGQIFGPGERGRRERERWRKNNSSLVLAVLGDLGDVKGGLVGEVRDAFEDLQAS